MKKIHSYKTISLYKFIHIKNIFNFRNILNKILQNYDARGIILLAPEGINLNISIISNQSNGFLNDLKYLFSFNKEDLKLSISTSHIFRKLKVKIKREILTTKNEIQIISKNVGKYIDPEDWDSFIKKEDVVIVDTRNNYEIKVGTFKESINPACKDFSGILDWISNYLLKKKNIENKKIAMFCTGGIRCEKATSLIKKLGHDNVYHLKGGILNYLEKKKDHSLWQGECFVFDNRVSVKKDLSKGSYELCYACRMPISNNDKQSSSYVKGISCPYCHGKKTGKQILKYKTRQKQIELEK